jgi:SAM-dependent methyltransferase
MKFTRRVKNLFFKIKESNLSADQVYRPQYIANLNPLYDRYSAKKLNLLNSISLDLGAGANMRNPFGCEQVFGIDISSDPSRNILGADLVLGPIPFDSNSLDFVTSYDFLEHVPRIIYAPQRRLPFIEIMNEIFRVLKPGGIFLSHTPIFPYHSAFRDPTHINILTSETFPLYFDDKNTWGKTYGFNGKFKVLEQCIKPPHLISILQKV